MLFKLPSTFHTLLALSLGADTQPSAIPPPNPRVLHHSPPLGMPRIDLPALFVLLWLTLQTPSPSARLQFWAACPQQLRPLPATLEGRWPQPPSPGAAEPETL